MENEGSFRIRVLGESLQTGLYFLGGTTRVELDTAGGGRAGTSRDGGVVEMVWAGKGSGRTFLDNTGVEVPKLLSVMGVASQVVDASFC